MSYRFSVSHLIVCATFNTLRTNQSSMIFFLLHLLGHISRELKLLEKLPEVEFILHLNRH